MRSLVSTAPDELRGRAAELSIYKVLARERLSPHRTDRRDDAHQAHPADTGPARPLSRRRGQRDRPILTTLVAETAPELSAIDGVGTDVATALLVAAGDNPQRLKNESTFAKLCGVSPSMPRAASSNDIASTGAGIVGQLRPLAHRVHPDGVRPEDPVTTSNVG